MELKHCPKCDTDLPLNMFGKNKSKKDGLQNYCKEYKFVAIDKIKCL